MHAVDAVAETRDRSFKPANWRSRIYLM